MLSKKNLVLIIISLNIVYSSLIAQDNTSSPYSLYGIGDIEPLGYSKIKGMGGAGYALSSDYFLNNTNPASYNGIDSLTTLFEIGVFDKRTKIDGDGIKRIDYTANLNYIAMGFRAKKWWGMSVGLSPYSSIGYKIQTQEVTEGSLEPYDVVMQGTGGLTQFYIGNSIKIGDNLSLGINADYLFGTLDQTEELDLNNSTAYATYDTRSYSLHKICFDYGVQYHFNIHGLQYSLGAVFAPNQKLKSSYTDQLFLYNGDTLNNDSWSSQNYFTLPAKIGGGIAINKGNKLVSALDYTLQLWSHTNSPEGTSVKLENSQQINWGLEYSPNDYFHKSYMRIMSYRIGAYYKATYVNLSGIQIKSYGMTAGVALPINTLHTKVNLTLEIGQRGTLDNSLIKENYTILHVGFTLGEVWFYKHKYE